MVMVLEYADGGDLFNLLSRHGGRLSERMAVDLVLKPFLRVMHLLHSRGLCHRLVAAVRQLPRNESSPQHRLGKQTLA